MTSPLGVDDFFALEAGEYLERLAGLVATPAPAPDELVRFTRALRGSALMASQTAIARAAGGLEALARAYREGRFSWETLGPTAGQGVVEIKALVTRIRSWTEADTARADRLAHALEAAAGVGPSTVTQTQTSAAPPETGLRAFVAREGAVVGSVLDQAAQALRSATPPEEPLQAVLRRMQPLRGLAALTDFPPLPDLLDGVEHAVDECRRGALPPEQVGQLLGAGAQALSRAARDVAERGRPDPDAGEIRRFTDLLLRTRPPGTAIVPIESLFFADGAPGIVQRGTAPRAGAPMDRAELVSRGEHLCQVADGLERAATPTQRDLRLHALEIDLRSLAGGVLGELGSRLAAFSDLARDAVTRGSGARVPQEFAARLREAGELLRVWAGGDAEPALLERLSALSRSMLLLGEDPSDLPIVPIESLAPDEPVPVPVPAPAMAPLRSDIGETPDLAGSYLTYARLIQERGLGPASLDVLLQGPPAAPALPAAPAAASISAPAPRAAEPPDLEIRDISELCYRGRDALQRAAAVKLEIRSAMAAAAPPARVQPLVEELLDLVELALIE